MLAQAGWQPIAYLVWLFGLFVSSTGWAAQDLEVVERQSVAGKILAKTNHSLVVQTETGATYAALYQDAGVRAINLSGNQGALNLRTTIRVLGELPLNLLRPGMAVEVELDLVKEGHVGDVRSWKL